MKRWQVITAAVLVVMAAGGALGASRASGPPPRAGIVVVPGTVVQANPDWRPAGAPAARPPVPRAPALPAAKGAVLFSADFSSSDTGAWQSVPLLSNTDQPAVWLAREGVVQVIGDVNGDTPLEETLFLTGQPDWHDLTLEAGVLASSGEGAGLVWNVQGDSYYRVQLFPNLPNAAAKAVLERVQHGAVVTLAEAQATAYAGYSFNDWQTVRVTSQAGRQQVWINGVRLFDVRDGALAAGQVGLYAWADSHSRFDNVRVQRAAPAP